jgi:hypothetical protein
MSSSRARSSRWPILALVVLAVAIAGGAGLWYVFFRPAGPPPVSLATLPPLNVAASHATTDAATDDPSADASERATSGDGGSSAGLDGTWSIDPSVGSFSDFSGSFVGYRVTEQLATVGAAEAVGRTPDVSGTLTIKGTTITVADITANLTTLQSDEANRARDAAGGGPGDRRHGDRGPDAPRGNEVRRGAARGTPRERRDLGRRVPADRIRGLRHPGAARDDRPLG